MKREEAATDALLRQFLLGTVDDEERQRVESLFLTDSLMKERVLAAEQELIDDYLEDCLSTAEREAFILIYGDTETQRRKLRIAKSIQEWAVNQSNATRVYSESSSSTWSRLRSQFRFRSALAIPIVVTAVVIVSAVVWIVNRRSEQHKQYLAVQHELIQLNNPSNLREVLPGAPVLTLKPGSIRSADPPPELTLRGDVPFAELRLLWMQREEYSTYLAVVRRSGDDKSYTIPNLTSENKDGKVIRVRMSGHLLTRGTYQIELSGVSPDRGTSPPDVYTFTVVE